MTRFIDVSKYRGLFKPDPPDHFAKASESLEEVIKQVEAQKKDNWTSDKDDDLNTLKRALRILKTRQK